MKVLHINHSDNNGGAARAAYRIHQALRKSDVDSKFLVNIAATGDWTVDGPTTKLGKAWAYARPHIGGLITKLMQTENKIIHSSAVLPSGRVKALNRCDADILHLHWVQNEMLSISDIGNLRKPILWTLHDMWAFCGAEHVAWDERWRGGYRKNNRPKHEGGFDLNRWTWERKLKHWKTAMHIVTPSRWLAECVRNSALMGDWPVTIIPNCIDTEKWQPIDKKLARQILGLPLDAPLLLFGTAGANSAHHKGFDLLTSALNHLRGEISELEIVIFGQQTPRHPPDLGFTTHYVGHLHDEVGMQLLYSAADVLAIPSRIDNFPNTGVESMACGTPVVGFDVCGLSDIIDHQRDGYLSRPFDPLDFGEGILWLINNAVNERLARNCRNKACDKFGSNNIAEKYRDLYSKQIN